MNYSDLLKRFIKSPWLPRVVNSVLVILIGWGVVTFIMDMLEPALVQQTPLEIVVKIEKDDGVQDLSGLHLFGEAVKESVKSVDAPVDAPVTKLNLTLRGILATIGDPTQGYAQIENDKKVEENFGYKDQIFGLATLEQIHIDRVIISRNGKFETLRLPIDFLGGKHFLSAQRKLEQKKIVTDFRKLLVNRKGMDLIKLFGFDTVYKNGGFYGFVIKVLGEDGQKMIDTLGVKEGDIIVAVNGEKFSESIQAVNNLTKLKDATSVNVEVDREGIHLFFDLEFDETVPEEAPSDTNSPLQNSTDELTEEPEIAENK